MKFLKERIGKHMELWRDWSFVGRAIVGLLCLAFAVSLSYIWLNYLDTYTGYVVPDLLLDHLPVLDVGFIFFQGAFLFILILTCILILLPESLPFTLATSALFFLVRSVFMVMTHVSAPVIAHYSYYEYEHHVRQVLFSLSSGNDLFFSGHTGYPFLLALIFWRFKWLRYFFLASSVIGAAAVLLGHLHYSIDVFSAYFITYGIFEMGKRVFKRERTFFA